jgi:hypothetical protein
VSGSGVAAGVGCCEGSAFLPPSFLGVFFCVLVAVAEASPTAVPAPSAVALSDPVASSEDMLIIYVTVWRSVWMYKWMVRECEDFVKREKKNFC